jgi:hypothetical protein
MGRRVHGIGKDFFKGVLDRFSRENKWYHHIR